MDADMEGALEQAVELPAMKDSGTALSGDKVSRTEIPDSEADTEEAVSPVKGAVAGEAGRDAGEKMDLDQQDKMRDDVLASMVDARGKEDEAQSDGKLEELEDEILGEVPVLQPVPREEISSHTGEPSSVDYDSMIVFPELTTSDLQPTNTQIPTQTQTQGEIVDSHFADAVAVMSSNVANATQDIMSSFEVPNIHVPDNVLNSSGDIGDGEVVRDTKVADRNQDIVGPDQLLVSTPAEDLSFEKPMVAKDVAVASPGIARSVPDSDVDEDFPDVESSSKEAAEEHVSHCETSAVSQSTIIAPSVLNDKDNMAADIVSHVEVTVMSENQPLPETPKISFKASSSPAATESESQPNEPTSSSMRLGKTASEPSKAESKQNKEKSPMTTKSFKGSDASQQKDVLMAELKAIKIASIQARNAALEEEIRKKKARLEEVTKELKYPAAETVKLHIKLLHDYNDIRDVGQGLVGMIADNRGVRIGELYEEFGVGLRD